MTSTELQDVTGWLGRVRPQPSTIGEVREYARTTAARSRADSGSVPAATETDQVIAGPAGEIKIRVLRPANATGAAPTVVYLHGGGWVVGDIDTYLGHARRLSSYIGAVVVSVEYRLAPEHRFPAAFDDAAAATEWAFANKAELGGTSGAFIVAGDGVGGQLAASVAIARRDVGAPLDAQLLLYPATDVAGLYNDDVINAHYMSRRTVRTTTGLTTPGMVNFANYYVAASESADWRVSPIRCQNLAGVAPAVIHTATLDVLRTEGNFYGDSLRAAGVTVINREFPTFNHSHFGAEGVAAVRESAAAQAADDIAAIVNGLSLGGK
jgi:acetyl esterase